MQQRFGKTRIQMLHQLSPVLFGHGRGGADRHFGIGLDCHFFPDAPVLPQPIPSPPYLAFPGLRAVFVRRLAADVVFVYVAADGFEQLFRQGEGLFPKHHQIDLHLVFQQEGADFPDSDLQRQWFREPVVACGNQRKRDGLAPGFLRQRKGLPIAGR